ncbi:hypothetical protein [Gulosibacter sediminis]|uniref:hypothetical protein n=1 Tax=Gulosibacter sediminis TaxID=1729695 RepID=UPI0024A8F1DB|nr:hypothetical protein [Gulosibacter sediminis]
MSVKLETEGSTAEQGSGDQVEDKNEAVEDSAADDANGSTRTVEGDDNDGQQDADSASTDEVDDSGDELDEGETFDKERAMETIRHQRSVEKELRGTNKALSLENRQLRVAIEKKLPMKLAERLRGDSLEDMRKDADELSNGMATGWQPEYEPEGGNRPGRGRKQSARESAKAAASRRFKTNQEKTA